MLVDERQVVRIAPGTYANVTILPRGTLELDPGEYDICGIRSASPTAIRPRGNVVVRIHGDLKISRFGLIEPLAGSAQVSGSRERGKALRKSSAIHGTAINTPDGGAEARPRRPVRRRTLRRQPAWRTVRAARLPARTLICSSGGRPTLPGVFRRSAEGPGHGAAVAVRR